MGQGLRVWDQNGNIIVDTNNRLPRVLGQIYVNWFTNDESTIYVPDFAQGTPWLHYMVDWSNCIYEKDTPKVSDQNYAYAWIEGSNVKWSWYPRSDGEGYHYATWIVYGVY